MEIICSTCKLSYPSGTKICLHCRIPLITSQASDSNKDKGKKPGKNENDKYRDWFFRKRDELEKLHKKMAKSKDATAICLQKLFNFISENNGDLDTELAKELYEVIKLEKEKGEFKNSATATATAIATTASTNEIRHNQTTDNSIKLAEGTSKPDSISSLSGPLVTLNRPPQSFKESVEQLGELINEYGTSPSSQKFDLIRNLMKTAHLYIEGIMKINKPTENNLLSILYMWCSPTTIATINSEQLFIFKKILDQYGAMNPTFHKEMQDNYSNNSSNNNNNKSSKRDFQKSGIGVDSFKPISRSPDFIKLLTSEKKLRIGSGNIYDSANNDFI